MKKINFSWTNRIGIGVMTGTSCDSIDISAVQFSENSLNQFTIIELSSFPYPIEIYDFVQKALSNKVTIAEISQFNYYISDIYSKAITEFIEKKLTNIPDFVAVHGQTIWHNPTPTNFLNTQISSTYQAINISVVAKKIGIPVVGDFRAADIALGGQGAPLVPIFDYHYFRSQNCGRVCVNIGGISNVTILPKDCSILDVIAFDCGPGNALIDLFSRKYFNLPFDYDGNLANSGIFNQDLFDILTRLDTYQLLPAPKSTGKEHYNSQFLDKALSFLSHPIPNIDILNTLTHYTAYTIAEAIKKYIDSSYQIILSGGGIHNKFLIRCLQHYLPNNSITSSSEFGIDPDFKEAIAFAFLGYLLLNEEPANVPSATGAKQAVFLGTLAI